MLIALIAGIVTFILTIIGIPAFIRFYHKARITDFGKSIHAHDCLPFFTNFPTPFVYFDQGFESLEIFGNISRWSYADHVGSLYSNGCWCAID